MFAKLVKSLFGASAQSRPISIADEDIPRYPPFARGIPTASVDRIIVDQRDLIRDLRQAIGLPNDLHNRVIDPVIRRYAEFVHLLPASQQHHHRAAGGLFRHGLEVALLATRATEDVLFSPHETPQRRRDMEPRWRAAAMFAGLTHDCGKPLSDLMVTDRDGKSRWRPHRQSLLEWAEENGVDRYFLHWQSNRHRKHEQFSATAAPRILTPEAIDWLDEFGSEIYAALLSAIAAPEKDLTKLNAIIRYADNASVEQDMKRNGSFADESIGVPVDRHIMDAARRLVNDGTWKVNQPGARVWVLQDGVYIVWKAAAEEIFNLLRQDSVPGIPRDADSIADLLIERDLAKSREKKGVKYRYWPICPDLLEGKKLMMLRLSHAEMLFNEPPAPTGAKVEGEEPSSTQATKQAPVQPPKPPAGESAQAAPAPEPPAPTQSASPRREGKPSKERSPESVRHLNQPDLPGVPAAPDQTEEGASAAAVVELPDPVEAIAEGDVLMKIAAGGAWDKHLHWKDPHIVVSYPDGMSPAGDESEVLTRLKAAGYVVTDPMSPMRVVRTYQGVSGVVLSEKASAYMRRPVTVAAPTAAPAQAPAQPAAPSSSAAKKQAPQGKAQSKVSDDELTALILADLRKAAENDPKASVDGDWVGMGQVAIATMASRLNVTPGDIRRICSNHPDIKLVGSTRVMVRRNAK
jgi:conjugal transfer pilus assembly protein TraI